MKNITWVLTGLLSGAAIALTTAVLVVPEIRARRDTPARIAACHDQAGTAQLDERGVFTGCLVPPQPIR